MAPLPDYGSSFLLRGNTSTIGRLDRDRPPIELDHDPLSITMDQTTLYQTYIILLQVSLSITRLKPLALSVC